MVAPALDMNRAGQGLQLTDPVDLENVPGEHFAEFKPLPEYDPGIRNDGVNNLIGTKN